MENRLDANFYNSPIRPNAMPVRVMGMPVTGTIPLATVQHNRPSANAHAAIGTLQSATVAPAGTLSNNKQARKDRGPNWMQQEILALIAAKCEMFLEELDAVDGQDLMTLDNTKWLCISQELMRSGLSPCLRDGSACKTKWNQILPEYKCISDYLGRTGKNVPDYWDLSPTERKEEGLPKQFALEIYYAINNWYGNRPQIQPPHVRDLLAPNDSNYKQHDRGQQVPHDDNINHKTDDPMDLATATAEDAAEVSTPPRSPLTSSCSPVTASSTPCRGAGPSVLAGMPMSRPRAPLPAGITPHIISSSDTSAFSIGRRPGNTSMRKKTVLGHTVIAEATKTTGAVMAQQMHDIAESSCNLERSKIDVQLKLFSEQMAYQRDKDRRLYENAVAANENARLSILKQGEIVNCLAYLSTVLSMTLKTNSTPEMQSMLPQSTEHDNSRPTAEKVSTPAPGQSSYNRRLEDGIGNLDSNEEKEGLTRKPQKNAHQQHDLPMAATEDDDEMHQPTPRA